jgi:hypothetical protein
MPAEIPTDPASQPVCCSAFIVQLGAVFWINSNVTSHGGRESPVELLVRFWPNRCAPA